MSNFKKGCCRNDHFGIVVEDQTFVNDSFKMAYLKKGCFKNDSFGMAVLGKTVLGTTICKNTLKRMIVLETKVTQTPILKRS